jgi:hypothetical protein
MIKLKSILSEGYAWEREPGKPLPTLEQTTAAHAAKLAEQSAEQPGPDPMLSQQDDVFDIIMTYTKDPDEAEAAYEAWLNGDSMPDAIEANVTRDPRWAAIRQPQREAAKPDFLDLSNEGAQINNKFGRRGKFGPGSRYNDEPDFDKPQSVVYRASGASNNIVNPNWDKLVDKYNSTPGFKVETDITSKRYVAKITNNATGNWWEIKFKFNEWSYTCQVAGKYKRFDDNDEFIDNFNEVNALSEAGVRPDYIDLDGDGDKEESMRKAAADREDMQESFHRRLRGNLHGSEFILAETFSRK